MEYDVVGVLGRGGAAVVELAVDRYGRRVATKRVRLTGSATQMEMTRRRLRREVEVLRQLAHPGVVPLLDVVDRGDEMVLVFPAMFENLEDRVQRLGPFPPYEVGRIGQMLLGALAVTHRHGIVHRDIKPSNVLFDWAGQPALSDFGAATTWEVTAGLTPTGTVLGTPMWMAPEQARGQPAGPPSDVFSLGATLGFAATGGSPYGWGPPDVLIGRAARGEIEALPASLPESLRAPLQRMLDPRPEHRPSAAGALGGIAGTELNPLPGAGRISRPKRARRRFRSGAARLPGAAPPVRAAPRRRVGLVAVALAALAAAIGAAALVAFGATASKPRPAPHTAGKGCAPGWYNLDGRASNGCEAHSDFVAGTVLTPQLAVHANVVPESAVDSFPTHVSGSSLDLCWGSLHVTLTAPPHTAEQVTISNGTTQVAQALSANGAPATATVHKPSCFGADSEDLTVTVTAAAATGGASATDFTLTRDSGW
ncbi:MAG TPA: serine/threonine-protein kinase [Acidimicrobiales bacterium]|nr:serine/threonine-protein kinase [Acidimicrobiales bacterium]